MKKLMTILAAMLMPAIGFAQQRVVLITVDGYRWQELFGGADSTLLNSKEFGSEKLRSEYWRPTPEERRSRLMPFVWSKIARDGVMLGNRWKQNKMHVRNKMQFSYPGYNELLCGYADDARINSNGYNWNPNVTVLEAANNTERYHGKVLAFASWDVFTHILNEQRSGLEVNTGFRHSLSKNPTADECCLNHALDKTPRLWSDERFDSFTHAYAIEAMKSRKPEFIYIAYGDTDDFGHMGDYRLYLEAAEHVDQFIKELWELTQNDSFYKDKTTFIITCDHGRGDGKISLSDWRDHGPNVTDSGQTWFMAFGKGVQAVGEQAADRQYWTAQVASTTAWYLGIPFASEYAQVAERIEW